MRNFIFGILLAAALSVAGSSAAMAAPVSDAQASAADLRETLQQVQYGEGGYCERLRRACVYKYERGEGGEGNCRKYRQECGQGGYCERLRRACENKYERGEEGQGNCRRYRNQCGGQD